MTAAQRNGEVAFVHIESTLGGTCRIRNPWPDSQVVLERDSEMVEKLNQDLLEFGTGKDEQVSLIRA